MAVRPPLPKPPAAPLTPEQLAAEVQRRAKHLEVSVDAWIRGQRLAEPASLQISIGERGKIPAEVLTALCGLYTKAGWSQASTTQDLPELLLERVEGEDAQPLDLSAVSWNGTEWIYTAPPAPGATAGVEYAIATDPRFAFTTRPDARGIVLHLVP